MIMTIPNKNTLRRMKIKFVLIIRPKIGKTSVAKRLKSKVVRLFMIKQLKGATKMKNSRRKKVNEVNPKGQRHVSMSKQG